jgi:hypothetical protein
MNAMSWTMASPLKEQRHHRTPSQSIGNNYTPAVQQLKIKTMAMQLKCQMRGVNLPALERTLSDW